MKKIILYTLYFILAFCVFAIALMPARFAVEQATLPKNLILNGVNGIIWNATIQQVANKDITLNSVDLSLSFWSLLTFSPQIHATFGDTLQPGPLGKLTATYSNKVLTIENADINVAVSDLLKNAKLIIPIEAKGSLDVHLDKVTLGKPICSEVIGNVRWPKARVKSGKQNVALGTLTANLGCEKGALTLTIDENNDLGLSITAYMHKAGRFKGNGTIKPGDKFPAELTPILSFLGKPNREGKYPLRL